MALKHTNPSDLPKHKSPDDNHRAIAPYNFVPLPDMIIPAVADAEALPNHNTYAHPDYPHTGYFEVTLTTLTPTYIRGMLTEQEFRWQEEGKYLDGEDLPKDGNPDFRRLVKNKPDFFMVQEKPVIPGSSLRGMLRQLVEVVTYSKLKDAPRNRLVYRAVGDPSTLGTSYRDRVLGLNKATLPNMHFSYPAPRLKAGYLKHTANGWAIQPAREFLGESFVRVEYNQARPIIGGQGRQLVHDVFVAPASRASLNRGRRGSGGLTLDVAVTRQVSSTPAPGLQPAKLVESGHMGGRSAKHWHCAIYEADLMTKPIAIPEDLWLLYESDRDMTRGIDTRRLTKDGDPLFYLLDTKGHPAFWGPTVMFRMPYENSPYDLIREYKQLCDPAIIDFAEAIFGFIRTREELNELKTRKIEPKPGSKGYAYAGRVFVTDARYNDGQGDLWLKVDTPDGVLEPHILASPKPTSFQHYLTQQNPNNKKELQHYDSSNTTLRGFKLYWAQGQKTAEDLRAKSPIEDPRVPEQAKDMFVLENGRWRVKSTSTQHTRMKPIANGKTFTFRIHFENLSDVELGALQWVLTKPQCHRLGMGKPLGMGVVKLQADLYLTPRVRRYTSLLADWDSKPAKSEQDFSGQFESSMTGEGKQFQEIERIKMLLKMLEWTESDPHADDKQYITQLDIFRERFVLPNPQDIGTLSGSGSPRSSGQRPSGGPGHGRRQGSQHDAPGKPNKPPTKGMATPPYKTTRSATPQVDERVRGIVDTIEANGDVYLKPENEDYRQWLLRIVRERQEGIHYQPGQQRACIVLELLSDDEIVECEPAPKKR